MIKVKRAYDSPAVEDGARYLVDRIWPRGLRRDALALEGWLKDVAPSDELREWFGHRPERWSEFRRRYAKELDKNPAAWQELLRVAEHATVTLVYGTRDKEHNNAIALKGYLEEALRHHAR